MREFKPQHVPAPAAHLALWPQLPKEQNIDLEIGAGAGLHAIRYSQQNPQRFLIALERTSKADRMLQRVRHHPDIKNLLALRCDAIPWVTHFCPPQSLSRIFLLYPNPYPKSTHKNLRFHHMPFMSFLLSRLKSGGEITLATNEDFYAEEAQSIMASQWGLETKSVERLDSNFKGRTHFEKKYLNRGELCWNLIFRKTIAPM